MKVSEAFLSVQGEGTHIGVPSFFIRLTGCNLRCPWCDSKFSSYGNPEGTTIDPLDLVKKLKTEYNDSWNVVTHVVITGGEPLIQMNELVELCSLLKSYNKYITIETNGTIRPHHMLKCDLYSISPKTSNSEPTDTNDYILHKNNNISAVEHIIKCENSDYQLKFVYDSKQDLNDIKSFIMTRVNRNMYGNIPSSKVFLMPMGNTLEEIQAKSLELVEICKETGFTLSTRLHIYLWGTKRGV